MRIGSIACAAIAALSATAAFAQNWVHYDTSGGIISYFATQSLRRNGTTVRVWIRRDLRGDPQEDSAEARALYRVDCAEETLTLLSLRLYDEEGRNTFSTNVPAADQEAYPVAPGTSGANFLDAVCT